MGELGAVVVGSGGGNEKGLGVDVEPFEFVVERRRIELPTFALRTRRSPS